MEEKDVEKSVEEGDAKLTEKGVTNIVSKAIEIFMKKKEDNVGKSKKEDEIAEYLKEKLGVDNLDKVKDILKKSKKEEKNVEKKKTDSPDIDSILEEKMENEKTLKKLQKQIEALKKDNEEKELAEKKRKISDGITENIKQNISAYGINEKSVEILKDALCENSDIDENGQIIFKDLDGSVKLNNKGENYSIGDAVTDLKKIPKYEFAFERALEYSGANLDPSQYDNPSLIQGSFNFGNQEYISFDDPDRAAKIHALLNADIDPKFLANENYIENK